MQYKVLILDVDGTLIASRDSMPSVKVTEAIKKVQKEKQVKVILATSRPWGKIKNICRQLALSGFAVVSGGAGIVSTVNGKPYQEHYLTSEKIEKICAIIQDVDKKIDLWIQDNGTDHLYTKNYKADKPFVIVAHHITGEQANILVEKLVTIPGIYCTKTVPYTTNFVDLNITHERGTKQKGIETVLDLLQIAKEESIGVGDGYNDLPIFAATGVHVAVGNAVEEIKKRADYIAPSVEQDGVATVIQKYFY